MPVTAAQLGALLRNDPTYKPLADDGSPTAVADILAAINLQDRQRTDHELRTSRYLIKRFGTSLSRIMLAGFKAAGDADPLMAQMWIVLANGLDFADADVQANIDILAGLGVWQAAADAIAGPGNFPNADTEIATQLKEIGIWYESHAEQIYGEQITAELLDEAMTIYARDSLAIQVTVRYNEVRQQIEAETITTWEEARTALGGE